MGVVWETAGGMRARDDRKDNENWNEDEWPTQRKGKKLLTAPDGGKAREPTMCSGMK